MKTESGDPRIYMAAERTFLAWMRTGLSMMGFGFVVARFGLFLREIAAGQKIGGAPSHGLSPWIGTVLVLLGACVNAAAAVRFARFHRRFTSGEPWSPQPLTFGMAVASTVAAIGLGMAVYLVVLNK